jgi:hypothetical protein
MMEEDLPEKPKPEKKPKARAGVGGQLDMFG